MQVSDLLGLLLSFKVPVEKTGCQEERLVLTLEIGQHLDHPVDHAGSEYRGNLVILEAIIRSVSLLELARVSLNLLAILDLNVDVLTLDLCRISSTQVERWMLTDKTSGNS